MTYDYQVDEYSVFKAETSSFQLYYTDDEYLGSTEKRGQDAGSPKGAKANAPAGG